MAFAKGNSGGNAAGRGGRHALGRQQPTGKAARSGAGKGKGLFSRSTGKHSGGKGSGGSGKGGAADGCDRWG